MRAWFTGYTVYLNSDIKKNILYSGSVNSTTSIVLTDNVEKYGLLIAENDWGASFVFAPNKSANIALPYLANNSIYIDVINVTTSQNNLTVNEMSRIVSNTNGVIFTPNAGEGFKTIYGILN